jgi:predicted patatin/cPLA2 family phospholipase
VLYEYARIFSIAPLKVQKIFTLVFMRIMLKKFPKLVDAMSRRHIVYNEQTADVFAKADRGEVFVICPEQPLGISRTEKDPDELQRVYDEGRRIALELLPEIKRFLDE